MFPNIDQCSLLVRADQKGLNCDTLHPATICARLSLFFFPLTGTTSSQNPQRHSQMLPSDFACFLCVPGAAKEKDSAQDSHKHPKNPLRAASQALPAQNAFCRLAALVLFGLLPIPLMKSRNHDGRASPTSPAAPLWRLALGPTAALRPRGSRECSANFPRLCVAGELFGARAWLELCLCASCGEVAEKLSRFHAAPTGSATHGAAGAQLSCRWRAVFVQFLAFFSICRCAKASTPIFVRAPTQSLRRFRAPSPRPHLDTRMHARAQRAGRPAQ